MKSLILLNKNIKDYDILKKSILDNNILIDYDKNIIMEDIITNNLSDITNLTLIYHHNPNKIIPFFDNSFNKFKYISDELFEFFKFIKNNTNMTTIDLITCFINSQEILNEINIIKNELNIDIRFSENSIGYDNWSLTSHNIDIKNLYFNDNIYNWKNTLGQNSLQALQFLYPSLITKSGQIYTLTQNISLPADILETQLNSLQLDIGPIMLQDGDIFDGNGYTITCTLQNNGIFKTPNIDGARCTVKNLKIVSNNGINMNMGGFVPSNSCNITISNCISECPSGLNNNFSGGFTGRFFGLSSPTYVGFGLIENCHFIGDINGNHSGGIGGYHCGNRGNITIQNCYSTGDIIGTDSGGICGSYAGYNGSIIIDKCHSSGIIQGDRSGGICGSYCGTVASSEFINGYHVIPINSNIIIENCYSTGEIAGNHCGGIAGSRFAGYNDGPIVSPANADMYASLEKCWSSGEITGDDCGGITGSYTNNNNGYSNSLNINRCYSLSKNITTTNSGGICGSYAYGSGGGNQLIIGHCYTVGEIGNTNGGIIGAYSRGIDILVIDTIAYNINNSGTISILGGGIIGPNSTTSTPRTTYCGFDSYDNNSFYLIGTGSSNTLIITACYYSISSLRYSIDFLDFSYWIAGSTYNNIYPRLKNFTNPSDQSFDYKYITYLRTPNYYFSETEVNTIVFVNNYDSITDDEIIDLRDWMIQYIFDTYNIQGFELNKDSMGINNITNPTNKQQYILDKYIIYRPNNVANPLVINPYGSVAYKGVYCPLINVNDVFYFRSYDSVVTLRTLTKKENNKYLYSSDSIERDTYYTYLIDKLRLVLGGTCIMPLLLKPIQVNSVITTPNVTPSTLTTQISFTNNETNATGYRIINYYYDEGLDFWFQQWVTDVGPTLSTATDTNWIGFPYDGKLYGYRVIALGDNVNWFNSYEYYPVIPYNYPYMVVNSITPQVKTENVSTVIIDNGDFDGKYITAGITIDSIELITPKQNLITKNGSNQLVLSWNSVDTTQYLIKRYYYINNQYVYDTSFTVNNNTSYNDTTWDTTKKIIAYTITAKGNETTTDSQESLKMPYFNNYSPYIIIADILCRYSLIGGIKTLFVNNNTRLKNYFAGFSGTELSNKRSQAFYEYFQTYGQNDSSLHLQKGLLNFNSNYTKSLYKILNYDIIKSTTGFINLSNYNLNSYGIYIPLYDNYSEAIFYTNDDLPDSTSSYYKLTKYINDTDVIFGLETGNINDNYFIPDSDYSPYYLNDKITLNRYNLIIGGLTFDDRGPIPCFTENTQVLTSKGYINIKNIKIGDYIITPDYRKVQIKNIHINIVKGNSKNYPYIIEKNSIALNYPLETFSISGDHLIKYKNKWILPKNIPNLKKDTSQKIIKYYHIELENYETDNLIINDGTIVESFGYKKNDYNIYLNRIKNKYIYFL